MIALIEDFDDIATLTGKSWVQTNNSSPLGITNWLQGNTTVFVSQSGAINSYISANYNNVGSTQPATISNWLITPVVDIQNGGLLSFYTRTTGETAVFPDRLQVLLSLNGSSTNVGTTATSIGDFTTTLLDINPNLTTTDYPTTFTKYDITLAGIPTPTMGRFAFRYFIPTDAGSSGNNGDYIGIDTFSYNSNVIPPANVDLSVIKTDNPDPVIVGNNLTYTVTVTNTSTTDAAANVVLTDTLPAGVTFVSVTPSQGNASQQNGVVTANLGTIAANGTATATIVVTPTATGSISNTAIVSATQPDPNTTNNTSTQATTVNPVPPANVDLSVIKTDNPDPVIVGNNLTYTVTVTNTSTTDAATNVVLKDTLPTGVTFGSVTPSQGNASQQNGVVTANLGTIAANGTATATIVVTPTATGSISNTASVTATQPDPNTTNNTSTQSTTVNPVPPANVDLSVVKTDNPDPVIVGNNLTYTVTVTNTSTTDAATNVILTDTLPTGVTFGSVTPSQGNASAQNGIVTANFGTISANGTATATIIVTPTATGSISNTASVSATQPDPNTTNNTSTQSTTVNPVPNDIRLAIAAKDANKLEGNTGNTPFLFTATRTGDTSIVTTANWAVTGAATNPANATDFAGGTLPNGTVSFGIGETTKDITVNVSGDVIGELDENFTVALSNPSTPAIVATPTAAGSIINDDKALIVTPINATQAEGNSGTKAFTFNISRKGDTTGTTVKWSVTGSGSTPANAADFVSGILPVGKVQFLAGETNKVITVNVNGDTTTEFDENFSVTISAVTVGTTPVNVGTGTILNDDGIIRGTIGNDTLIGTAGNDVLIGVAPLNDVGTGQVDRLTGSAGSDRFVLADSNNTYYLGNGISDYALITDFGATDVIQTRIGSTLTIGGILPAGILGTALYLNTDLVAVVVQGTVPTSNSFVAV